MSLKGIQNLIKNANYEDAIKEIEKSNEPGIESIDFNNHLYCQIKSKKPITEILESYKTDPIHINLSKKHADHRYLSYLQNFFPQSTIKKILKKNQLTIFHKFDEIRSNTKRNSVEIKLFIQTKYKEYNQRNLLEYRYIDKFDISILPYSYLCGFNKTLENYDNEILRKISIIYCAENHQEGLRVSIESLVNSFNHYKQISPKHNIEIEIIILSDIPRDPILPRLKYENIPIKYCYQDTTVSGKHSSSLNFSVNKITGDLVTWCDANCLFPENFFTLLNDVVKKVNFKRHVLAINCYATDAHVRDKIIYSALSPYGFMWFVGREFITHAESPDESCIRHGIEFRNLQCFLEKGCSLIPIASRAIDKNLIVLHLSHNQEKNIESKNTKEKFSISKNIAPEGKLKEIPSKQITGLPIIHCPTIKKSDSIFEKLSVIFSGKFQLILFEEKPKRCGDRNVYIVDQSPSSLELYRSGVVQPNDVVLQVVCEKGNQSCEDRLSTINWLRKLGLDIYGLDLNSKLNRGNQNEVIYPDQVEGIIASTSRLENFTQAHCTNKANHFNEVMNRLKCLELPFLTYDHFISLVDANLEKNQLRENAVATDDVIDRYIFPNQTCALYIKNKFYNDTGKYENNIETIQRYYNDAVIFRNFYAEIIYKEVISFKVDPQGFLAKGATAVFLDPSCYGQESAISSYLLNLYKFFKMSRLVQQTLYIKNPFSSTEPNNQKFFRVYIANLFNDFVRFKDSIIFFDSNEHYPGINLNRAFIKICITNNSGMYAGYSAKEIPNKITSSYREILKAEVQNIKSARLVITPTSDEDKIQQNFYAKHLPDFQGYVSRELVNYIHDEYFEFVPFKSRHYDLAIAVGTQEFQYLDLMRDLICKLTHLKFAIFSNESNKSLQQFQSLPNAKIFNNINEDKIYDILRNTKFLIDLSSQHECDSVILKAINAKTPAILKKTSRYKKLIKNDNLLSLFCFIDDNEISNLIILIQKIDNHLSALCNLSNNDELDKFFNDFLLNNYLEHFSFYENFLSEFKFEKRNYRTSSLFNNYLKGKNVINVVHSNSLSNDDGKFIDGFDLVIRFNRALEKIKPSKHGKSTHILYSCINWDPNSGNMTKAYYDKVIKPSNVWVVKAYPNLQWKGYFSFVEDHQAGATYDNYFFEIINSAPEKSSEFSLYFYKIIEANIKSRPNTGVLAILDLLQYEIKTLYLKGYTFFKGGYDRSYRNLSETGVMAHINKFGHHNLYSQHLFMRKIILTDSRIKFDERLAEILFSM